MLWKRLLAGSVIASGLFVGLVGFAHTKPGRPLRPMLVVLNKAMGAQPQAKGGACPLGYDQGGTPADMEAARQRSVAQFKGATPSPTRPALAFTLKKTSRQEIEGWAKEHGVSCNAKQGPLRLTCAAVPASALPATLGALGADEIYFQFDPSGLLVSVGTVRSSQDPQLAADAQDAIVRELTRQLGAPSSSRGEPGVAYLQGGLLRQARAEFRFSDYYATSSATSVGRGRFVISERYELLADGS